MTQVQRRREESRDDAEGYRSEFFYGLFERIPVERS